MANKILVFIFAAAVLFGGTLTAHAQEYLPTYGGSSGNAGGVCPFVYAPVCGVNGQTFSNSCFAQMGGVPVLHPGPCNKNSGYPTPLPNPPAIPCYGYFSNPAMVGGSYAPRGGYSSFGGSYMTPYGNASAYGSQSGNSWMQFFQRPFGIQMTNWSR